MDGRASLAAPVPAVARRPVAPTGPEARRELMLGGPIVGMLLRLSAPTIVVVTAQALVGVLETSFVGFLGTDALAGVALVVPVVMLMQRSLRQDQSVDAALPHGQLAWVVSATALRRPTETSRAAQLVRAVALHAADASDAAVRR